MSDQSILDTTTAVPKGPKAPTQPKPTMTRELVLAEDGTLVPAPPDEYISLMETASLLGMSRQRVSRLARAGAFKTAYRRGPGGSPLRVKRQEALSLAKWYRETITITEAADLVGVDRTTVYRWIIKAEIRGGQDAHGEWRAYVKDIRKYTPKTQDVLE